MTSSRTPSLVHSVLQVVCGLAEPLRPFVSQLAPVLCGCLAGAQGQEQPPAVRLAALRAVAAFLQVRYGSAVPWPAAPALYCLLVLHHWTD